MLRTYRLDHPDVAESKFLGGWSYLWASLLGPLYVLIKGFVGFSLLMLLTSIAIGFVAFGGLGVTVLFFGSTATKVIAVLGVPIVALIVQGIAGIKIVRAGYMSRGWREAY
ncbi:MAG: hypothetical protein ACHQK9_24835 [Reyranellales bacterium]